MGERACPRSKVMGLRVKEVESKRVGGKVLKTERFFTNGCNLSQGGRRRKSPRREVILPKHFVAGRLNSQDHRRQREAGR